LDYLEGRKEQQKSGKKIIEKTPNWEEVQVTINTLKTNKDY